MCRDFLARFTRPRHRNLSLCLPHALFRSLREGDQRDARRVLHSSYRISVVQAIACAMRPVRCPGCNNKVVASALSRHEEEMCPQRLMICEQGCGENVPVSSMRRHLAEVFFTHSTQLLWRCTDNDQQGRRSQMAPAPAPALRCSCLTLNNPYRQYSPS